MDGAVPPSAQMKNKSRHMYQSLNIGAHREKVINPIDSSATVVYNLDDHKTTGQT
jgi:hypothetical protein